MGGVAGTVGELRGEGGGAARSRKALREALESRTVTTVWALVSSSQRGCAQRSVRARMARSCHPKGGGLAEPAESAASLMGGRDALEEKERADAHLPRTAAQEVDGEHDRQPEQGPKASGLARKSAGMGTGVYRSGGHKGNGKGRDEQKEARKQRVGRKAEWRLSVNLGSPLRWLRGGEDRFLQKDAKDTKGRPPRQDRRQPRQESNRRKRRKQRVG